VVRNVIKTGPKLKPAQKQMLSATMAAVVAAAAAATVDMVAMVDMVAGAADAGLRPKLTQRSMLNGRKNVRKI